MSEHDGGNAFPAYEHFIAEREDSKGPVRVLTGKPHGGMSLRDYFAAKALVLLCDANVLTALRDEAKSRGVEVPALVARHAFELADAMLAHRGKS